MCERAQPEHKHHHLHHERCFWQNGKTITTSYQITRRQPRRWLSVPERRRAISSRCHSQSLKLSLMLYSKFYCGVVLCSRCCYSEKHWQKWAAVKSFFFPGTVEAGCGPEESLSHTPTPTSRTAGPERRWLIFSTGGVTLLNARALLKCPLLLARESSTLCRVLTPFTWYELLFGLCSKQAHQVCWTSLRLMKASVMTWKHVL